MIPKGWLGFRRVSARRVRKIFSDTYMRGVSRYLQQTPVCPHAPYSEFWELYEIARESWRLLPLSSGLKTYTDIVPEFESRSELSFLSSCFFHTLFT